MGVLCFRVLVFGRGSERKVQKEDRQFGFFPSMSRHPHIVKGFGVQKRWTATVAVHGPRVGCSPLTLPAVGNW